LDEIGLIELGIFEIDDMNHNMDSWCILLNGKIVGGTNDIKFFGKEFRELRKKGKIHKFVSIFENVEAREVEIWSDAGRMVRPLINYHEFLNKQ